MTDYNIGNLQKLGETEVPPTHAADGHKLTEGVLVRLWRECDFTDGGVEARTVVELTTTRGTEGSIVIEQVPDLIDALRRVQQYMR